MKRIRGFDAVEAWPYLDALAGSLYQVEPGTDSSVVAWRGFFMGMVAIIGEPQSETEAGQLNREVVAAIGNAADREQQAPKLTEIDMTAAEWVEYIQDALSRIRVPDDIDAEDPFAFIKGLHSGAIGYLDTSLELESS